jgi:exodeoxyribonuclease V alpha subunit
VLASGLDRLFPGPEAALQHEAAEMALRRRFTIVAGGPGTGKTTTVARILALHLEQAAAAGVTAPRVALAAPTGKAAARLAEAVHHEAARLDVSPAVRDDLLGIGAATLHRLLGWRPGHRTRFAHHHGNRLAHDLVVVDETSMVSLSLMVRLLEAVRPDAAVVLVGDPHQLASVEAGAVLGDLTVGGAPAGGVVTLQHVYRYGGAIAALAAAVQRGDADAAVAVLHNGGDDVEWIAADVAEHGWADELEPVRACVVDTGRRVLHAAQRGDGRAALQALGAMRLLCAHRRGPYGVSRWMPQIQAWLAAEVDGLHMRGEWYPGRPLLVTRNDYGLGLYNGDTGVVVSAGGDRLTAVFQRRGDVVEISPTVLSSVETVYAMTVHKSQGSQFESVAVVLPDQSSPILTRELLYTAVTRAQNRLTVVATEDSVRAAVQRPVARASGLQAALGA